MENTVLLVLNAKGQKVDVKKLDEVMSLQRLVKEKFCEFRYNLRKREEIESLTLVYIRLEKRMLKTVQSVHLQETEDAKQELGEKIEVYKSTLADIAKSIMKLSAPVKEVTKVSAPLPKPSCYKFLKIKDGRFTYGGRKFRSLAV